jgi:poly-gamma-glutamate synthesis protein (capsule biosynthesis protein)
MRKKLFFLIILLMFVSGCQVQLDNITLSEQANISDRTATPFLPVEETSTPTLPAPPAPVLWIDPVLPGALTDQFVFSDDVVIVENIDEANVFLEIDRDKQAEASAVWVYSLVAPFATLTDEISYRDIQNAWAGQSVSYLATSPLLVSEETYQVFRTIFGDPAKGAVEIVDQGALTELIWERKTNWGIVPFDALDPQLKIIKVDGQSPVDWQFDINTYPLSVNMVLKGDLSFAEQVFPEKAADTETGSMFPISNRDPEKMTTVVMTGVTALVRATGAKMEKEGMLFPGENIRDWLLAADFTHISNEVSFDPDCPPANPYQTSVMFCSRPEYIALLDDLDIELVELSGNHVNDWRAIAFDYSLDLYAERGWQVFAGGVNDNAAKQALKIEHHGNKLAFIGCNPAGPEFAWATADSAGAAKCDYDEMMIQIAALVQEGYLPIVTQQYFETYSFAPLPGQIETFTDLSKAGAVIVSGSQAHFPQGFTFVDGKLIHYGLGNLFFDQMDNPVVGTRREFIDRHIFYDGRHISTEILTAMLEDYAQPRPMTPEERQDLLYDAFVSSGWMD